jgi:hypothetical protein
MNKQTATLIANEAIAFLAKKHGVTEAQIEQACRAGDVSVINQIAQLLTVGIAVAA